MSQRYLDWRHRRPNPANYYAKHVQKLGHANASGWAQGICPFHDDHQKSLSVHVTDGHDGWLCFAGCGSGDLIDFHRRLRGLGFEAAIRDLIGGGA